MSTAKATVDKRKVRGEESRRVILKAAVSSIAALGLGNLTLDRVAERAGLSRALVVFHFKSKNKLLEEVLGFLSRRYSEGWKTVVNDTSGSNIAKLLRLVDFDIRFAYDNPEFVSAWHAFWGESKGNLLYRNLSFPQDERNEDEMENLIALVAVEGGYDINEVPLITRGLGAMMFGVWIESHLDYDANECELYLKSVRLFLSKFFPNHSF